MDDKVLALVNVKRHLSSTLGNFVSCRLDDSISRKVVVKMLVADLRDERSLVYGCSVTGLKTGMGRGW